MAIVADGFEFSVTLVDKGGNTTTRTYGLRGADYAEAAANAVAALAIIDAKTLLNIASYSVRTKFVENALVNPTDEKAQAEVNAAITARIKNMGIKSTTIMFPAPIDTIWVAPSGANSNVVNIADGGDADAIHGMFETAAQLFISDGEDIGALVSGVRVTKGKRGG